MRSTHVCAPLWGVTPATTDIYLPTHPHNRTLTTGSLFLLRTCVHLPQTHTSHKTTASEPLILASLVLQHTGGRACVQSDTACVQSYIQASPRAATTDSNLLNTHARAVSHALSLNHSMTTLSWRAHAIKHTASTSSRIAATGFIASVQHADAWDDAMH